MEKRKVHYHNLGANVEYTLAVDIQEKIQKELISKQKLIDLEASKSHDYLLLLEHSSVFTLGKSGKPDHLLSNKEELEKIDAVFTKTNRGGDITFHGPGQLVGYPILDLNYHKADVKWYMRKIEEVIIKTIAEYGILGERSDGETGVWLDVGGPYARKIAQLGVKLSRWVTLHGFSLNANVDLAYFEHIIPCGIKGKAVTSIEKEIGKKIDMEELKTKILTHFSSVFNAEIVKAKNI